MNSFDISDTEWSAAQKYKDNYFIYMVVKALTQPKITTKMKNPHNFVDQKVVEFKAIMYKISW